MRHCLVLTLGIAVLVPSLGLAQGGAAPSVVVFQIEPRGAEMTENELGALSSYLGSQVGEGLGLRVVGWQDALAFLRTKDLYFCLDRSCQMEVEAALRVDHSLVVVINKMGQTCVFNATLYPSGSPASQRTAMVRSKCQGDAYLAAVDQLVAGLSKGQPGLRTGTPAPVQRPGPPQLVQRPERPVPVQRPGGPRPVLRPESPAGRHGIETSASAGEAQGQSQVEQPAASGRAIDHYRRFYIVGGLEYSPAPILYHEFAGDEDAKKVPDHYGPTISFDVRIASYLLLGAQAGLSIPSGARQFQTTVHVGGLLPLSGRTCLLGRTGAGLSWLRIDQGSLADTYTGLHGWLGLGLRHQFTELLGLEVQMAGMVGSLGGPDQAVTQLRLLLQLGLVFGFGD